MKTISCILIFVMLVSMGFAGPAPEKKEDNEIRPALVVIDIQNIYLSMMDEMGKDIALWMINETMKDFRQKGFPVILVYHTDPNYGPKPGSEEFKYPASIEIKEKDLKIIKNYPNAFKKTDLEKVLREKGCNTLFLCGLSAVGCVLATYFGANDLDFNVFMIKNALISHNATYTKFVEDICETLGPNAITLILQNAKK
jgi:nicotinamidase-related amidase